MATVLAPKFRREDLRPGESLCDHCTAKCCKYFALQLDTPECRADMDYLRWYLLHGETAIFTEDDAWYLVVFTTCKHLQPDNRCGIYFERPKICRDYTTDACEFDDSHVYDRYFECAEQLDEYTDAFFPTENPEDFRSRQPPALPILSV